VVTASEHNEMDPDTAFALLSNERRRHVLCLLAQRDEELSLQTVATEIIVRLDEVEPEEIDEGTYRSVYVSLYQNHVPRLADAGVVQYDEDGRTVRIAHNRRTWELLDLAGAERRRSWRQEGVLVLGATVLATLGSVSGVVRVLREAWMLPTLVLIGGLLLLGGYQYYMRYRIPVTDCGVLAK
jgi:DNA-binding transcriptional ArsR family regulator